MIFDTTREAQKVQIEILRKMSPEKRLALSLELGAMSHELLVQGVRERHPEYKDNEVKMATIRLILPEKLFLQAFPWARNITP